MLQLQEVAKPVPKDNEVLIRIHATTVTAADSELRGLKFPLAFRLAMRMYVRFVLTKPVILGQELAGGVEAVGNNVTRFRQGDQVLGWTGLRLGAYGEYICLPENGVLTIKPPTIIYEQAAPLPVGGLDAVFLMKKGHIQSGERVLINGAGGSIGAFAVQLAKYYGAEVTGVDSAEKLDMLRSLGADHVIDYTREDFTRSGKTYDVILDVIGKSSFSRSIRSLAPNGRYLLANPPLSHRMRGQWMSRRSGRQVLFWTPRSASEYAEDFKFLTGLLKAERIQSVIDRCYPLEQIAEAHRYVDSGHKKGNVVIMVNQNDNT
jgi:NADPH:quinone reductase-like Zn-dependent oxidoreductase